MKVLIKKINNPLCVYTHILRACTHIHAYVYYMHIHTYSHTYISTYIRPFTRPSVSTCPAHMYAYAWTNKIVLHNFNNHVQSYGQKAKLKKRRKNLTINLFIYLLSYQLGWFIKIIWDITFSLP